MVAYKMFFNELIQLKNKNELINLFDKYNIKRRDRKKYPDLEFNINVDEIVSLKNSGIITSEDNLNELLPKNEKLTSLEKLFYAVMWKNGDLVKIKHIISGICGENTTSKVFNQFGKYLRNKEELIIDQHVLRAYIFYKDGNIIKDIKDKHYDLYFNDYKTWINNNNLFKMNKILIDELLFGIGKKMKTNR
jgi:hypothetical protein